MWQIKQIEFLEESSDKQRRYPGKRSLGANTINEESLHIPRLNISKEIYDSKTLQSQQESKTIMSQTLETAQYRGKLVSRQGQNGKQLNYSKKWKNCK